MSTMKVWLIWVQDSDEPNSEKWLVDAMDDESRHSNPDAWAAMLAKAEEESGARNVRVTTTYINFDAVQAAFDPADVTLPVMRGAGVSLGANPA